MLDMCLGRGYPDAFSFREGLVAPECTMHAYISEMFPSHAFQVRGRGPSAFIE